MTTKKPPRASAAAEASALIGRLRDPGADAGPDMARLESDYRAGVLTMRELGKKHSMSHTMVGKHAAAGGWTRDLKHRIRAKADEMMNIVLSGGSTPDAPDAIKKAATAEVAKTVSSVSTETEEGVVFGTASAHVNVRLGHMRDIRRLRALALRMVGEIEAVTDCRPELERLRVALAKSDDVFDMSAAANLGAVIEAGGRVKPLKDLTAILQALIAMEREAYGIAPIKANEDPPAPPPDLSTATPQETYQWFASQKPG